LSNSGGRGTIGGETHPPTHGAQTMQGSPEKIDKRALERVGAGGPERGGRQEFSPLVRGCVAVTSAALRSCVWMWSFVFGCGCLCSAGAVCLVTLRGWEAENRKRLKGGAQAQKRRRQTGVT
jgi:hypothetical protein